MKKAGIVIVSLVSSNMISFLKVENNNIIRKAEIVSVSLVSSNLISFLRVEQQYHSNMIW